jgi:hypothetical protein
MHTSSITDYTRGWFIGDFEPSILKTKEFEVALLTHAEGEVWPDHFHAIATEYNLLVSGSMQINDTQIAPGTIFVILPGEIVKPIFHEDCTIVCVKVPSVPTDKHLA